jgi:GAF domain-containing protein
VTYLDTKRFDRLSDEEVLDRIGALLAVAIGRREQQRQLTTQVEATRAAPSDDPHLAALDFSQLVTDPLEARIIMHLRAAGRANAREAATSLGVTTSVAAQKLARLCAAGLCRVEDRSRPACYRLRTEYTSN